MGKRGPKPEGKVKIKWSPDFAYAVGLITTDGNLSPDGRHINFTSKDRELIDLFQKTLNIKIHIGRKASGSVREKKYFVAQFSDVLFYKFLLSIGLIPRKSKTLREVYIPEKYFYDFLRGHFDGDGCTHSYWDPRWRSSFMFYTIFVSASKDHVAWIRNKLYRNIGVRGHITGKGKQGTVYQLKYAKRESLRVLRKMYHSKSLPALSRKRLKIEKMLSIVGEQL